MSYYGEGTMCRRADVLRVEAHELAACMVALAELLAAALEVHQPPAVPEPDPAASR